MRAEVKSALIVSFVFLVLVVRLGYLQIIKGDELRALSEENHLKVVRVPAPRGIIFDRNGHPLVENKPFFSVILRQKSLIKEELFRISEFLEIPVSQIEAGLSNKRSLEGIRLKEGLSFDDVTRIEARLSDYPSLDIEVGAGRNYILNDIAAHLIGYLGKPTPEQLSQPKFQDISPNSLIGQWGVERLFDSTLRGKDGERVIEVDSKGKELREVKETPPINGKDLYLSIDLKLQSEGERAFGDRAGALVALKPDTGEVLALVSRPSFNPNLFINGVSKEEWTQIQEGNFPMLNRAIQSQYPPGSVFKIITGISALESESIDTDTAVGCSGGLKVGTRRFGCWRKEGHGVLTFHNALKESCDVYFYTAGKRAGIENISKWGRLLGVGSPSGLNLVKEKTGLMPDDNWKKEKKNLDWYLADTIMTSIGQGYVLLTPFQIARLISVVANGGYIYNATLIRPDSSPVAVSKVNIKDSTLSAVREALKAVVNEPGGTAFSSRSKFIVIAGKTGTAQTVSNKSSRKLGDHAWFAAYAPYEKPEVALSVLLEHGGHGGASAAPIARRAIEAYLAGGKEDEDR